MPVPIEIAGRAIDMSSRIAHSETVAASPSAATETTIATITLPQDVALNTGVFLWGWAAFTVGGSGTASNLRIRQTDTSGAVKAATGALTTAAAALFAPSCIGFDASPTTAGVYVLTLTVTGAVSGSTVSAVELFAFVV
jgi:hypothetical protein